MNVPAEARRRVLVCPLSGELDLERRAELWAVLDAAVHEHPDVLVIDLACVTFCDSVGLGMLLRAGLACQERNIAFRLAALAPAVARTLELTGIHRLLDVRPSVEGSWV